MKKRIGDINWMSETEFTLEGVKFKLILSDFHAHKTSIDQICLIKSRAAIDMYQEVLEGLEPANFLEFGVFQGGSPIFFSLFYHLEKFVGVDISPPITGFDEFLRSHPVGERIKIYYEVSQDDEDKIHSIVAEEFGEQAIDIIIDDASHQYELTRRSFEIGFPLLKPGGIYAIEDWGWAHWKGFDQWEDAPAMSNLIFELIMVSASHPELISEIRVFPAFAFVTKSPLYTDKKEIKLDKLYDTRGRTLTLI